MEAATIIRDIHWLNHRLEQFERKYGFLSRTFYQTYSAGQEPVCDAFVLDFAEWAGLYETWRDRQGAYIEMIEHLRDQDVNLFERTQSA